jgi:hypothetical protein
MSLSVAIAANVLLCVALLGGLAYAMLQANRLTPHVPAPVAPSSPHQRGILHIDRSPRVRDESALHTAREQITA